MLDRPAVPVALPDGVLIEGRTYDLVILCTGSREAAIGGLAESAFSLYSTPDGVPVARKHFSLPAYRIGPHAQLPFTDREFADGIADIPANKVSMFRTAAKTAALAATLPQTVEG